jgi:hypothetical protein
LNELIRLLLRLSEGGEPVILSGDVAKRYRAEVDRLLAKRLLVEREVLTDWPVCSSCECDLDARPLQSVGDTIVAACPLDHGSDTIVDEDDLRNFAVNLGALATEVCMASGLGPKPDQPASGVWFLGKTSDGRAVFFVPAAHSAQEDWLASLMKESAHAARITIIGPTLEPGRRRILAERGVDFVRSDEVLALDGKSPFEIDVAALAPARAVRLILHARTKRVVLDGVERQIPDQPFKLLEFLMRRTGGKGEFADIRKIEDQLWGKRLHSAFGSVRDVVRDLRRALGEKPGAPHSLIEAGRAGRGYRLALRPDEVLVED